VFLFKVSPKPDPQKNVGFKWGANLAADRVFLKIFSSGFRLVRSFEFTKVDSPDFLTKGPHEFKWDGKDEQNRPMPPGSYFCFIDINVKKKTYEASSKTEIP
jgi:flagellar hook assembly protein FlgD